jgi:hypothetical protein
MGKSYRDHNPNESYNPIMNFTSSDFKINGLYWSFSKKCWCSLILFFGLCFQDIVPLNDNNKKTYREGTNIAIWNYSKYKEIFYKTKKCKGVN